VPWLLLGFLVCTPVVRAQIAGFDSQAVEIFGTVFLRELTALSAASS